MQRLWFYISHLGTKGSSSVGLNRHIILCNRLSIVIACLVLLLFILEVGYFGFGTIPVVELICFAFSSIPILLNAFGWVRLSRIVFCSLLPTLPIAISVFAKSIYQGPIGESFYYDYRYILLGISVIPPLLFRASEKVMLIFSILLILLCFILFDPIHNYFHVGYYQLKHSSYSYPFSGTLAVIIFILITSSALILKSLYESFEQRNEYLIQELITQTEKLNLSQKNLQDANSTIQNQKELLQVQNQDLTTELLEKNKSLTDSNTELIRHNNELRQFSYTVSHNLRGPVASLMGLLQLIDEQSLDGDNLSIFKHSLNSVNKLDTNIRDLIKIIDIRNDIFRIRQQIDLYHEVEKLQRSFEKEIKAHGIILTSNFNELPILYSVRPMVESILYNLVSNSIKYRSSDRIPRIDITSSQDDHYFIVDVKDNGLGIDMQHHKDNLFVMYKRFHPHTEGKGLGLFLVRLQAEALGGSVEIESEINRYTQFTVRLKKPDNVERQILFEGSQAQIFFDARINATGIIWNGPVTSEQYRTVFNKCLEFVKVYNAPNYLADLSHQGAIAVEDQQWMFNEIMPEANRNGLKRIAAIRPDVEIPEVAEYLRAISVTMKRLHIDQQFFSNMKEASQWLEEQTKN